MKKGEEKEKIGFGQLVCRLCREWQGEMQDLEILVAHGKGHGIFSAVLPALPHDNGWFYVHLLNSTAHKYDGPHIDNEAWNVKDNYVDKVVDYIWNFLTTGLRSDGVCERDQSAQRALEYIRRHGAKGATVWIMQARK